MLSQLKCCITTLLFCLTFCGCNSQRSGIDPLSDNKEPDKNVEWIDSSLKTIHIYVALCDNKYQGIVPVPSKIGNGQDPDNNLYWGCAFGIRSYFKSSEEWKLVSRKKMDYIRLERLVFWHASKNAYLIADAYDGQYIAQCTMDFLSSACGKQKDTIQVEGKVIGCAGNSNLVAYIGHDGLMDFQLAESFSSADNRKRDVIILACLSKRYFAEHLREANVNMLVWTTGLMAPEAYTIHDAITGYLSSESNEDIRARAARAYAKYQKCSEKAARSLLVTGW